MSTIHRYRPAVWHRTQMASPDVQPTYVRLPSELHAAVKQRAVADERTMAQTIRHALRYYLQQTSSSVGPTSPA